MRYDRQVPGYLLLTKLRKLDEILGTANSNYPVKLVVAAGANLSLWANFYKCPLMWIHG